MLLPGSDPLVHEYVGLVEFYSHYVNKLVIAAEKLDDEQRISIPAVVELRAALEHIMRAHEAMYGLVDAATVLRETGLEPFDYCSTNINKAYAHLYRAGYDAYDCMSVTFDRQIQKILQGISVQTLYAVIGSASDDIVAKRQAAQEQLIEAKAGKDVQDRAKEQWHFKVYEAATLHLKEVRDLLQSKTVELLDYERERRRKDRGPVVLAVVLCVVGIVGGAIVAHLLATLFSK